MSAINNDHQIFKDQTSKVLGFFIDKPKNAFKTMRYTLEWLSIARVASSSLKASRIMSKLISSLKIDAFVVVELACDLNTFRETLIDWRKSKANFNKFALSFVDAVAKTAECGKWLVNLDLELFFLTPLVGSICGVTQGASMVISSSKKTYDLNLGESSESSPKTNPKMKLWETAKQLSLFAIGAFIALASITAIASSPFFPSAMLFSCTTLLVSSFAVHLLKHEVESAVGISKA